MNLTVTTTAVIFKILYDEICFGKIATETSNYFLILKKTGFIVTKEWLLKIKFQLFFDSTIRN